METMMSNDHADYRGDVHYEEYRRGMPEGSLSDDRIQDAFYDGVSVNRLVSQEQQRQANRRQQAQQQQEEQEWQDTRQWEQEQ